IIGSVIWPLAARCANGFREAQQRTDGKVTNKIAGGATRDNNDANGSVAGEFFQRGREGVTHLFIEVNSLCTAKRNDCNGVFYSRGENIGVHDVLSRLGGISKIIPASAVQLKGYYCPLVS